jgi:hypothetical protein
MTDEYVGGEKLDDRHFMEHILGLPEDNQDRIALEGAIERGIKEREEMEALLSKKGLAMDEPGAGKVGTEAIAATEERTREQWRWLPADPDNLTKSGLEGYAKRIKENDPLLARKLVGLGKDNVMEALSTQILEDQEMQKLMQAELEAGRFIFEDKDLYNWANRRGMVSDNHTDIVGEVTKMLKSIGSGTINLLKDSPKLLTGDEQAWRTTEEFIPLLMEDYDMLVDGAQRLQEKLTAKDWEDAALSPEEAKEAFDEAMEAKRQFLIRGMYNQNRWMNVSGELAAEFEADQQKIFDQLMALTVIGDPTNFVPVGGPIKAGVTAPMRGLLKGQMRRYATLQGKALAADIAHKNAQRAVARAKDAAAPQKQIAKQQLAQAEKNLARAQSAFDDFDKVFDIDKAQRKMAGKLARAEGAGKGMASDLAGKGVSGIGRITQATGELMGRHAIVGAGLGAVSGFTSSGGNPVGIAVGAATGHALFRHKGIFLSKMGRVGQAIGNDMQTVGRAMQLGQTHLPLHQLLLKGYDGVGHLSAGTKKVLSMYDPIFRSPWGAPIRLGVETAARVGQGVASKEALYASALQGGIGYVGSGGEVEGALMGAGMGIGFSGMASGTFGFVNSFGEITKLKGRNKNAVLSGQVRLIERIHEGQKKTGWEDGKAVNNDGEVIMEGQEMAFGEWFGSLNNAEKKMVANQLLVHPDMEIRVFKDEGRAGQPGFFDEPTNTAFINLEYSGWNRGNNGIAPAMAEFVIGHEVGHFVGNHEGMDSMVISQLLGRAAQGIVPNSPWVKRDIDGNPIIRDIDGNVVSREDAMKLDADGNPRTDVAYEISEEGKARIQEYVRRMPWQWLAGIARNPKLTRMLNNFAFKRLLEAGDPDARNKLLEAAYNEPALQEYMAREVFAEQYTGWLRGDDAFKNTGQDFWGALLGRIIPSVGDGFFDSTGKIHSSIFGEIEGWKGAQDLIHGYNEDVSRGVTRETEAKDKSVNYTQEEINQSPDVLEMFEASSSIDWVENASGGMSPARDAKGNIKIRPPKQQKLYNEAFRDFILDWFNKNPRTGADPAEVQWRKNADGKNALAGRFLPDDLINQMEGSGKFNPRQIEYIRAVNDLMRDPDSNEALLTFYQAATGMTANGKRSYKSLAGKWRTVIPHGWEISKQENLLLKVVEPEKLLQNAMKMAKSSAFKGIYNGNYQAVTGDMLKWLNNAAAGRRGAEGIGEAKRNLFRVASGMGKVQTQRLDKDGNLVPVEHNELVDVLEEVSKRQGSYLMSFRTDRMNQVMPAYDRVKRNYHPGSDDAAYLKAVEGGDMKTAQRLVDAAARAAGYKILTWHGTTRPLQGNKFDPSRQQRGNFTTAGYFIDDPRAATGYAVTGGAGYYPKNSIKRKKMAEVVPGYEPTLYKVYLKGNFWEGRINREALIDSIREEYPNRGDGALEEFFGLDVDRNGEYLKPDGFDTYKNLDEAIDAVLDDDNRNFFVGNDTDAVGSDHPIAMVFSDPFVGKRYLEKIGADGVAYLDNETASIDGFREFATTYAPSSPNQIKSADPVTYDDNGNVIPLSERFNPKTDDIRYHPGVDDSTYMKAVEGGDMETAQRLVDAAARAAGYGVTRSFHGTANLFHKFDPRKLGTNTRESGGEVGFFVSEKYFLAEDYATIASRGGYYGRGTKGPGVVLDGYLKLENPKKFETAAEFYRESDRRRGRFPEWTKELLDKGYDGIRVREDGEEVVFFDPSQFKSADPVTYDDNGNVIPLSERFNLKTDDIRYFPGSDESDIKILPDGTKVENRLHFFPGQLYHGTRGKIDDKFSTEYVGEGEGVQAFGWGLYFAQSRSVAKGYSEKLAIRSTTYKGYTIDGYFKQERDSEVIDELGQWVSANIPGSSNSKEETTQLINRAVGFLQVFGKQERAKYIKRAKDSRDSGQTLMGHEEEALLAEYMAADFKEIRKASLYSVKVDADETLFLDWDKEFSQQSEAVQKALKNIDGLEVTQDFYMGDGIIPVELSGGGIYESIQTMMKKGTFEPIDLRSSKSAKDASMKLLEVGIRGIKFLDGFSRDKGEGTRNLVIFDADDITIVGRDEQEGESLRFFPGKITERIPEMEDAAQKLVAGKISREEYAAVVDKYKPVRPYTEVPKPATTEEMTNALRGNQAQRVGQGSGIAPGTEVGLRLDIPAYANHGVWIPTIHINRKPVAHESVAMIDNAVFPEDTTKGKKVPDGQKALNVAIGGAKSPFAEIIGGWVPSKVEDVQLMAKGALNDPSWTQVGFDPTRHSYFYNRENHREAVLSADRVIQIGPLVLAKNAETKPATETQLRYFPGENEVDPNTQSILDGIHEHVGKSEEQSATDSSTAGTGRAGFGTGIRDQFPLSQIAWREDPQVQRSVLTAQANRTGQLVASGVISSDISSKSLLALLNSGALQQEDFTRLLTLFGLPDTGDFFSDGNALLQKANPDGKLHLIGAGSEAIVFRNTTDNQVLKLRRLLGSGMPDGTTPYGVGLKMDPDSGHIEQVEAPDFATIQGLADYGKHFDNQAKLLGFTDDMSFMVLSQEYIRPMQLPRDSFSAAEYNATLPKNSEIARYLIDRGWEVRVEHERNPDGTKKLYDPMAQEGHFWIHPGKKAVASDTHQGNFIKKGDGDLQPIDLVVRQLDDQEWDTMVQYHPGITVSQENIPGWASRVLRFLHDADPKVRYEFHRDIRNAFLDEEGNDIIAQELKLEDIHISHTGKSVYINSKGKIEVNEADQISGFKTKADAEVYAMLRALYTYQEAGAGYNPSETGPMIAAEFKYKGEAPIEQAVQTVSDSLEAQGLGGAHEDFAFYPTSDGFAVVHLGFNDKVTPNIAKSVFADIDHVTNAIDIEDFRADTFYHENNWNRDNSGGTYRETLQGTLGKKRFSDLQKRLDGRILQRLQGTYEKYGVLPEDGKRKDFDPGYQQGLKPQKIPKDRNVSAPLDRGNLFDYVRRRTLDGKVEYAKELKARLKIAEKFNNKKDIRDLKKELRENEKFIESLKDAGRKEKQKAYDAIDNADRTTPKEILKDQKVSPAISGQIWKNSEGTLSSGTPTKSRVELYINDGDIQVKDGLVSHIFPNVTLNKTKKSLGKDIKDTGHATQVAEATESLRNLVREDPAKAIDGKGYVENLRKVGASGDSLVVPSLLEVMLNDADTLSDWILNGGLHKELTIPTRQNAIDGLDGTMEFRNLIGKGNAPDPSVAAPLFLWGILSRMLPPIEQESMWLRMMSHQPVLDSINASIEGTYALTKDEWKGVVAGAVNATKEGGGARGKNATSNANAYHAALSLLNGRWNEFADVFATGDAKVMRDRYWQLVGDVGGLGVKNKVLSFQGLTLGIPSWVGDRWQYVMANLPQLLRMGKVDDARSLFSYDQFNVPSDPTGVYSVYGTVDSGNPVFSNLLYEYMNTAIQNAIDANPKEFKAILGDHMNPGGFHWISWNAIKNEPVGHSSLSLLFELQKAINDGTVKTPGDVSKLILDGTTFTEGRIGGETVKVHFNKGKISQSKE